LYPAGQADAEAETEIKPPMATSDAMRALVTAISVQWLSEQHHALTPGLSLRTVKGFNVDGEASLSRNLVSVR
jgi:hypothetical protein